MSEPTNQPPEFGPKIPLWLKAHYDELDPMEKWKCDQFSIQDQQNAWMMERHMKADEHRTHINKVVDDLKIEVRPAVTLAKWAMTFRGAAVGLLTLIGVPTLVALIAEWLKTRFHGP